MNENKILQFTVIIITISLAIFTVITLTILLPNEKIEMLNEANNVASNWMNIVEVNDETCKDVGLQIGRLNKDPSVTKEAREIMLSGMWEFSKKCEDTGSIFSP